MSQERREELEEEALAELSQFEIGLDPRGRRAFIESAGDEVIWDRSWYFFAYSYCGAFEILWDAAYARQSDAVNYPLLLVCRHSIELWLKVAISSVLQADPPLGHGLSELWSKLMDALADHNGSRLDRMDGSDDGIFAGSVQCLIRTLDAHDVKGDRFRYPVAKSFETYPSTQADLEELYRAHSIITCFCDAVETQMDVERDYRAEVRDFG